MKETCLIIRRTLEETKMNYDLIFLLIESRMIRTQSNKVFNRTCLTFESGPRIWTTGSLEMSAWSLMAMWMETASRR
jgi:hypothetical protein